MELLASLSPGDHQSCVLKQSQMLHDAEARHGKPFLKRAQCLAVPLEQRVQKFAACWIGKRLENVIIHCILIRDYMVTCQDGMTNDG